ncbi:MAG: T9SS type A sorting domain-containing protein [Ignavibacteria bacterium]|nr:T9SS type A sorting domain-containing protein [Ignavibacteria bacterium]MCC7158660.1 T9SS type A sorting domain-containing protein [Ignavibacteria bacterium]
MKKIILTLLLFVLITGTGFSVVKVTFRLSNPHLEAGIWAIDVVAVVPAGQQWRVGSSNLRYDFTTTPPGAVTVHPDATVSGANPNLNSGQYSPMTTTSIGGGTAISLNIIRLGTCYRLNPGTYTLGRIRFNRVDTAGCITLHMRTTTAGFSVVQDSITQWLAPADFDSLANQPAGCLRLDFLTGTSGNSVELPTVFKLYSNYPNPFNPSTSIKYDIPRSTFVKLSVYDVLGKLVVNLVNQDMEPGRYDAVWDAENFASGFYIYRLETSEFTDVKKMVLLK